MPATTARERKQTAVDVQRDLLHAAAFPDTDFQLVTALRTIDGIIARLSGCGGNSQPDDYGSWRLPGWLQSGVRFG
ncbi:hypothetical protein [Mesorhizobium amorphae]